MHLKLQRVSLAREVSSHQLIQLQSGRKYNVLLYGISECSEGTSWVKRQQGDMEKAVSVISSVDSSISPQAVKDLHRLGQFKPGRDQSWSSLFAQQKLLMCCQGLALHTKWSLIDLGWKEEGKCLLEVRGLLIQKGYERKCKKFAMTGCLWIISY